MSNLSHPILSFVLLLIISAASSADVHEGFLGCLSQKFHNFSSISDVAYTPNNNSSYTSILKFSIWNLRFASESTPKPQVIITPVHESQIPPVILCAKQNGLEIRIRSGGHDAEGLSYTSQTQFVIIDLINLNEITIDAEKKTAWVGAGALLGQLYYKIAEKSNVLGFPAGLCPTVGVGGHISGGGYGFLHRKYGFAADNVIDARTVDANGRILDRESMGEDMFWAIRGGGGASFGVIVSWVVKLVDVPETVTVFAVNKTVEQNATQLVHRWQYVAPQLDKDLFIAVMLIRMNTTVSASFFSLFLGKSDRLLALMQERFPELGLAREDCSEMSWVESTTYIAQMPSPDFHKEPLEYLLKKPQTKPKHVKVKSDFVQRPMPESGVEGMVRLLHEPEGEEGVVYMAPHGGKMDEISASATPFPYRAGTLYKLAAFVLWDDDNARNSDKYISWSRKYYRYVAPFVPRKPRAAYLNYRDLDIGVNSIDGKPSYEKSSIWGKKYFNNNFDRLVRVKTAVDPHNFFKNEQSIPPLHSKFPTRLNDQELGLRDALTCCI